MSVTVIPGQGLMLDGHVSRQDALFAATTHLTTTGVDAFDLEDLMLDRPGLVSRAWWAEDRGFIQSHHDGAQPVTIVHVNTAEAEEK